MNSRDRLTAAWNGQKADHVPLTNWCFGITPPNEFLWSRDGRDVTHWYSGRMEFLHEIPGGWTAEDEISRFRMWRRFGIDDMLEISLPWGRNPTVEMSDEFDASTAEMTRTYITPEGELIHKVRRTGESIPPGWVTQPPVVRLIEDFNIPRGVKHLIAGPGDVPKLKYVFAPPSNEEREWFARRMDAFVAEPDAAVQAWTGFGIDGAVWFCGVEGALFLAMDHPEAFRRMLDAIFEVDVARTELAAAHAGVDVVVMRGWYSSTDFWSPSLFREFIKPDIEKNAAVAHRHGKKFAYAMTTGIDVLGMDLAEAGVDILYFYDPSDPISGGLSPEALREVAESGMTLVGGISTLALNRNDPEEIDAFVKNAITSLGPTNRFILQPVDALFPDTPWESVNALAKSWRRYRG